jgi:esterase
MELFCRKLGSGDPVIILHGLYGSSDNWYSIGKALADDHEVFMIDLRNHGHSPHHPEHNYQVMCHDVADFFTLHNLSRAIILGHSMGGKTAMAFGLEYPEKVNKMIVVDISPFVFDRSVTPEETSHQRIMKGLLSIHPERLANREEADMLLQKFIAPFSIRQFLLKNLKRDTGGRFYWALNIPVLAESMPDIFAPIISEKDCDPFALPHFPLLFIKGEYSAYIKRRDEEAIRHCLPWSQIITVHGTGHWMHVEQPAAFLAAVRNFIGRDS